MNEASYYCLLRKRKEGRKRRIKMIENDGKKGGKVKNVWTIYR